MPQPYKREARRNVTGAEAAWRTALQGEWLCKAMRFLMVLPLQPSTQNSMIHPHASRAISAATA